MAGRATLHITPEIARAAYELLRASPPFRRWGLLPAEEVEFIVRPMRGAYAEVEVTKPTLFINLSKHSTLQTLLITLAHEMCHLRLAGTGHKHWDQHGAAFKTLAARVCNYHAFDLLAF